MNRRILVTLVVLALLTLGLSAQVVMAQTATPGAALQTAGTGTPAATGTATSLQTVTVAAGQSARIPVLFWCLDFGKPFPTDVTGPDGAAPNNVIQVLYAARNSGTMTSNPYQTQLAIWFAADNTWHDTGNQGHAEAQQLVTAAGSTTVPTNVDLLGAGSAAGGLTVAVQNLQAVPDQTQSNVPPYHGTADLVVTNTGSQSVTFTVDGARFRPTSPTNAQNLVAQMDPSRTVQTLAGTATAEAQAAQVTTATPTTAATETATATETTAPTATVAPTSTPIPTSTAAAAVVTGTATSSAERVPSTLPTTGGGNGWLAVLVLFGALMLFAGLGIGTARRARR